MNIKKILVFQILGIGISYPIFYYLAHNGGLMYVALMGLFIGIPMFLLLGKLFYGLREKPYYGQLGILKLILPILFTFLIYGAFDSLTFGSSEEQAEWLKQSKSFTKGKIYEVNYYTSTRVKRKTIPEHWEILYNFSDEKNEVFKGMKRSSVETKYKVGQEVKVHYVKDNPDINEMIEE